MKIPKFKEPPKAIIVTFSAQFFYEMGLDYIRSTNGEFVKQRKNVIVLGYRSFEQQIAELNKDPEGYWNHAMSNPPADYKDTLQYCYISMLKKIRYKAKIAGFERAPKDEVITKRFGDGRTMASKGWLYLHDFEKTKEFPKNGFQGFRYVIPGSEIDNL